MLRDPNRMWEQRIITRVWTEEEVRTMREAAQDDEELSGSRQQPEVNQVSGGRALEAPAARSRLSGRSPAQRKRTWEVIGENGLVSYDIHEHPKYKVRAAG